MADSYVCSGATMRCTMGTSQARLTVLPTRTVFLTGKPQANISDHQSFVNLGAFGRCRSMGFPATASATAANHGTLTPMPCMHNTPIPWMNGKNDYLIKGQPALLKSSVCQCMWGGTISITDDGQTSTGLADVSRKHRESFQLRKAKGKETEKEEEKSFEEETDNLLEKASRLFHKITDSGKELKDEALDKLADTIYKVGGDKIVDVMDDIAKGKYFGTEQWKYLLDQSYDLMENGYVEGNALKKNAGSFLYLVCSAWQEDTWIDTFQTVQAGDNLIEAIKSPKDFTNTIEKINGKIKFVNIGTKTTKVINKANQVREIGSEVITLAGKVKK